MDNGDAQFQDSLDIQKGIQIWDRVNLGGIKWWDMNRYWRKGWVCKHSILDGLWLFNKNKYYGP